MSNTQEITEFDLSLLPGWDEELKCESKHTTTYADGSKKTDNQCSVTVTHRFSDCRRTMLICESRAADIATRIGKVVCIGCYGQSIDCWKVTPV